MRHWIVLSSLAVLAGVATGCAQTSAMHKRAVAAPPPGARVLLMAPDIELSELTASGALEPKAEWTEQARGQLLKLHDVVGGAQGPVEAPALGRQLPSGKIGMDDDGAAATATSRPAAWR